MGAQNLRADSIPPVLRGVSQWVLWRYERRVKAAGTSKLTKVPYRPNGCKASSTDPKTWSTFEAVLAPYHLDGFDGVGFVLTPPWCGVDFDDCVGEDGAIDAEVWDWVRRLDSYAEYSVSGTGLHVLARATLGPFGHKLGTFECYNHGRYFTVSGNHVAGTPIAINDATEAVREFIREVFPNRVAGERRDHTAIAPTRPPDDYATLGPRTRAWLESTGPVNGKPSASEADMAAACALLSTGHTEGEALALLLTSARGCDALARKGTGGVAYLQRTVFNAAARVGHVVLRTDGVRGQRHVTHRPGAVTTTPRRPGAPA